MYDRLPFTIPEFQRVAWVSAAAREHWEPKIAAVSRAWPLVERATVERTLRQGALQSVAPEQLVELQQWSMRSGVPMAVVGMEGAHESYGNASIPYRAGVPFNYRVYFGKDPAAFLEAWQDGDQAAIGAKLGFPSCCVDFFSKYWVKQGWRDLTYPATDGAEAETNYSYANVLLKPLGVRPVFHLPCAFNCPTTIAIGRDIFDLMSDIGYQQEATWSKTLLSMPMEWSSLHGIATVVTPILKLVYASDALPRVVRLRLTDNAATPLRLVRRHLNGFSSLAAMERAHRFIVDMLPEPVGSVVDLGCGDGALLRAIQRQYPNTAVQGVESKAELAVEPYIAAADLYAWQWNDNYRCVLLAMQRLLEVNREAAVALLAQIRQHAAIVLLYSYDGPHSEIEPLLSSFRTITSRVDDTHAGLLLEVIRG